MIDDKKIAEWLDTQFKGPFGIRFGWDSLIGLIPVVGDVATSLASFSLVGFALQRGAHTSVIIHMMINIGVDYIISSIPFFGNILDLFWKSNSRNLKLLQLLKSQPEKARQWSRVSIIIWSVIFVSVLALMAVLCFLAGVFLIKWVAQYL